MSKKSKRIILYYQTLIDLDPLISLIDNHNKNNIVTDITLASIHFGKNNDNSPYIHLNDHSPKDDKFKKIFLQLLKLKNKNVDINLLIGGAGTAFSQLFSNYDIYYNLLKQSILNELCFIDGFNLDIEEPVNISDIIKLVKNLKKDFPNKKIIFAPLAESIATDEPGMGGFSYKELYKEIGSNIDYFNVQCYGEYSLNLYNEMLTNGYPSEKIVMGMLTGQDFNSIINEIEKISHNDSKFGGVAVWEYFNAPPSSPEHPYVWCEIMMNILYNVNKHL
jgi:hypothetical protein